MGAFRNLSPKKWECFSTRRPMARKPGIPGDWLRLLSPAFSSRGLPEFASAAGPMSSNTPLKSLGRCSRGFIPAPELNCMPYTIVTGSSGFIGHHLCARLRSRSVADAFCGIDMERPAAPTAYRHIDADIRRPDRLRAVAAALPAPGAIFHLAAAAEVLTPWSVLPPLLS